MSANRKRNRKWGWPAWVMGITAGVMFVNGSHGKAVLAVACAGAFAWLAAPGNRARVWNRAAGIADCVREWCETRAGENRVPGVAAPCRQTASVSRAEVMRSWLVLF